MKAFVTGSTGLLGNNLVRLLVEQGHQVKALARSREKADHLFADLNVPIVQGDSLRAKSRSGIFTAEARSSQKKPSINFSRAIVYRLC